MSKRKDRYSELLKAATLKEIPHTSDNLVDLDLYLKGVEANHRAQERMIKNPPPVDERLMEQGSSYILAATQRMVQTEQYMVIERLQERDVTQPELLELHGMLKVLSRINTLLLVGVNAAAG